MASATAPAATGTAPTPVPTPVAWAQRPQWILLTVAVAEIDASSVVVALGGPNGRHLTISLRQRAAANNSAPRAYTETLELFADVDPLLGSSTGSRFAVLGRSLQVRLRRRVRGEYWPRLTADTTTRRNVLVDWGMWRDEEDVKAAEEEEEAAGFAKDAGQRAYTLSDGQMTVGGGGDPLEVAKLQAAYLKAKEEEAKKKQQHAAGFEVLE